MKNKALNKILNCFYFKQKQANIESSKKTITLQKLDLLTPPLILQKINSIWNTTVTKRGGANTIIFMRYSSKRYKITA